MNISGNNIEKWFFDYFEGNLSSGQTKELFQFLDEHPWHAEEFNNWKNTYNVPVHIKHKYAHKANLVKKTPLTEYMKYAAVALLLFSLGSLTTYLIMGENSNQNLTHKSELAYSAPSMKGKTALLENPYFSNVVSDDEINNQNIQSTNFIDEEINHSAQNESKNNLANDVDEDVHSNSNQEDLALEESNETNVDERIASANSNNSTQVTTQNIEEDLNETNSTSDQTINNENNLAINDNNDVTFNESLETEAVEYNNNEIISANANEGDYALNSTISQIVQNEHSPNYITNPIFTPIDVELEFAKSGLKKSSQFRKFTKKIIRMLDDPIALTNLRDPNLTLPEFNPIRFNSAFAGSMYRGRWETMHRYQWHNSQNVQHQTYTSYDAYVSKIKGGVGIMAGFSDFNGGMYRDYEMSLAYSPKLRISKNISFEPAVNFNVGLKTLKPSKFNGQDIEWDRGQVKSTFANSDAVPGKYKLYRDIGAGALLNTKWFYAGFHANNLLQHSDNIYNNEAGLSAVAPKRITAVIGTDYQSFNNPYLVVSPFVSYEEVLERKEAWLGTHFRWNALITGASVSSNLNYKGMIGFQVKNFRLSYSFDQTYSWMANKSLPSHELNMKIVFGKDYIRTRKTRY